MRFELTPAWGMALGLLLVALNGFFVAAEFAFVKIASVAAGFSAGFDLNFVQANHPPAASTTMTTIAMTGVSDRDAATGAGFAFTAAAFFGGIGLGAAGGVSADEFGTSSSKMPPLGAAGGGVNGASNAVAPPSAGTSSSFAR